MGPLASRTPPVPPSMSPCRCPCRTSPRVGTIILPRWPLPQGPMLMLYSSWIPLKCRRRRAGRRGASSLQGAGGLRARACAWRRCLLPRATSRTTLQSSTRTLLLRACCPPRKFRLWIPLRRPPLRQRRPPTRRQIRQQARSTVHSKAALEFPLPSS